MIPDPDLLVAEEACGTVGQEDDELVHLEAWGILRLGQTYSTGLGSNWHSFHHNVVLLIPVSMHPFFFHGLVIVFVSVQTFGGILRNFAYFNNFQRLTRGSGQCLSRPRRWSEFLRCLKGILFWELGSWEEQRFPGGVSIHHNRVARWASDSLWWWGECRRLLWPDLNGLRLLFVEQQALGGLLATRYGQNTQLASECFFFYKCFDQLVYPQAYYHHQNGSQLVDLFQFS